MTVCSSAPRRKRKMTARLQGIGDHDKFWTRITKTLYCGRRHPYPDHFSLPVTELTAEIFSEVKNGYSLDRLHVDDATEISRNTCASPASLVLALLYLERLKTCNSEYVKKVAPSELFLVSMMVASKFLHDDGEEDEVFNAEWAYSGGLKLKDMNKLEREFLNAINWEVYVSEAVFWERLKSLESMLALREGRSRGWFSYTELTTLVNASELVTLAQTLIAVSAVCLTSYTASVLVMVGSTIAANQLSHAAASLVSTPAVISSLLPDLPDLTPDVSTCEPLAEPLSPSPSSPTLPQSCMINDTSRARGESRLWKLFLTFPTNMDVENLTLSEENNNVLSPESFYVKKKNEWSEQKDWLTAISNMLTSHPNTMIPVEVVTF